MTIADTQDLESQIPSSSATEAGTVGTLVRNGGGDTLLIPEAELRRVDQIGRELDAREASQSVTSVTGDGSRCQHCGEPFKPRKGNGGKPQRFCSPTCRTAFHAPEAQRSQRSSPHVGEKPFPQHPAPGSAAACHMGLVPKKAPPKIDLESCWGVPSQDEIQCFRVNKDEIHIEQISRMGPSEDVCIAVARSNVVRLARSILYAAGFEVVCIATRPADAPGGYVDLEDGDLPESIT